MPAAQTPCGSWWHGSSVAGNAITVNGADANGNPAQTNVTVTNTTKYTKQASTDAQALAQGKCIAARGSKDDSGTLQAWPSPFNRLTMATARSPALIGTSTSAVNSCRASLVRTAAATPRGAINGWTALGPHESRS